MNSYFAQCDSDNIPATISIVRANPDIVDYVLNYSCYRGKHEMVKEIIEVMKIEDCNKYMEYAVLSGNNALIVFLSERITNYYEIFKKLCYHGNTEMVEMFMDLYLDKININQGMVEACAQGHEKTLQRIIKRQGNDFYACLRTLCKYGHTLMAYHMYMRIERSWKEIMGHVGDELCSYGFVEACRYGHEPIVKMYLDYDVLIDFDRGMKMAKEGNHQHIIDRLNSVLCQKTDEV